MHKPGQTVYINEKHSQFHKHTAIIVVVGKGYYDIELVGERKTRMRVVQQQIIAVVGGER